MYFNETDNQRWASANISQYFNTLLILMMLFGKSFFHLLLEIVNPSFDK